MIRSPDALKVPDLVNNAVDNLKAPLMCRLIRRYETVVVVLAVSLNERQRLPVGNQCPCNVN